jgi:Spy/CpxP family protein refolding chaperone
MNENIDDLKKKIEEQAKRIARLEYERDVAREQMRKLLPKATPEQEAQLRRDLEGPILNGEEVFAKIIAELEAADGN